MTRVLLQSFFLCNDNEFDLQENECTDETHFHKNGLALTNICFETEGK